MTRKNETPSGIPENNEKADLAAYIADMAAELAQIAGRADMSMLTYLLNLARVEAEAQSRAEASPSEKRRDEAG